MKRKEELQQIQIVLFWYITLNKLFQFLNNVLWNLLVLVVLR